jgi:hypothetical protein
MKIQKGNDDKNKITIKLSGEFEITLKQLASLLLPLLTAAWVAFQTFIPHNTENSIPVLPPKQPPIVQIEQLPIKSQFQVEQIQ